MSNRILSPSHNAPAHDLVATPQSLANLIVSYFNPSGRLLDPSAGDVTKPFFTAMLQPGIAAEYVDWCEIGVGLDFFDYPARVEEPPSLYDFNDGIKDPDDIGTSR